MNRLTIGKETSNIDKVVYVDGGFDLFHGKFSLILALTLYKSVMWNSSKKPRNMDPT